MANVESDGSSTVRVYITLVFIPAPPKSTDLLAIALLGQKGEGHSSNRRRAAARLACGRRFTILGADWEGYIEQLGTLEFSGLEAVSHHLGIFALKVSLILGVDLFLLSSDDDIFIAEVTLAVGIIFNVLFSSKLVPSTQG